MEKQQEFTIIQGTFKPDEAKKILTNIIGSKIQYHVMEGFGSRIRDGKDLSRAEARIQELTETQNRILACVESAEAAKWNLGIFGTVAIRFIDSK